MVESLPFQGKGSGSNPDRNTNLKSMNFCEKHNSSEFSNSKRPRCKKCLIDAVNKRRRKVKSLAIEYKGGKCEVCGYDKCNAALDFHHINKEEKEFGIGSFGHCNSWEKVKEELDKCMLVCANCHREIHSESNHQVIGSSPIIPSTDH